MKTQYKDKGADMMQRRMCAVCFALCCLLLTVASLQGTSQAADTGGQGTLLILLDASGSMDDNDSEKTTLKWVQGLWAICDSLGINTEVVLFREEAEVYEENIEGLSEIEYSGESNHLDAIEKAKSLAMKAGAGPCGIVMLSDGVLDLVGRKNGSLLPPRSDDEIEKIDGFLQTCRELEDAGKKLLFIGFGEENAELEDPEYPDPYKRVGFGMLQTAAEENNCTFMRAVSFPDEDIMCSILDLLGFSYKEDFTGTVEDNVIRFELDEDYYKCGLCISKTGAGQITKENIRVTWIAKDEDPSHSAVEVEPTVTPLSEQLFFVCLDQPEAGNYAIEMPDQQENTYSIFFMGNLDLEHSALQITLTGENGRKDVQETDRKGDSIEYTVSSVRCTIHISLEGGGVPEEYITEYQCGFYSDPDMDECYDTKTFMPSPSDIGPLELSRDIDLPTDVKDGFIIQVSLLVNGTPLESNKLHVKLDLCNGEIPLLVNIPGDIPRAEDEVYPADRSSIRYYVMEIQGDGSRVACDKDKYDIDCDRDPAQITFKQEGNYCVQTMCGDKQLGASQRYTVTDNSPPSQSLNKSIFFAALILILISTILVVLIYRHGKRKN